jgi:hypothetical protein
MTAGGEREGETGMVVELRSTELTTVVNRH